MDPFRQNLSPRKIKASPTAPMRREPACLARTKIFTPIPKNARPNNQAPIRCTRVGFGDPFQRKASTILPFRSVSGQTIFRCLAWMSSMNRRGSRCRFSSLTSMLPASFRSPRFLPRSSGTPARRSRPPPASPTAFPRWPRSPPDCSASTRSPPPLPKRRGALQ
jgi:hypothetical protein